MSIFLTCLNYLSYFSNLLEFTYLLNNKVLLLEHSPAQQVVSQIPGSITAGWWLCYKSRILKRSRKSTITLIKTYHSWSKLTTYKHVALNKVKQETGRSSRPCKHYAHCGCHGKDNKSMIPTLSHIEAKNKTFPLKKTDMRTLLYGGLV